MAEGAEIMMTCNVCTVAAATCRVTVAKTHGDPLRFDCCDDCEPRDIPLDDDVVSVRSEPIARD